MSIEKHQGFVKLTSLFDEVWNYLNQVQDVNLNTSTSTGFTAKSGITRDGRQVIKFIQEGKEYGRVYQCCWGCYYNCNKTRIGMYAKSLDDYITKC